MYDIISSSGCGLRGASKVTLPVLAKKLFCSLVLWFIETPLVARNASDTSPLSGFGSILFAVNTNPDALVDITSVFRKATSHLCQVRQGLLGDGLELRFRHPSSCSTLSVDALCKVCGLNGTVSKFKEVICSDTTTTRHCLKCVVVTKL